MLTKLKISDEKDGTSTFIWQQHWILQDFNMSPIVSKIIDPPLLVADLITAEASWDMDKLAQIFLPTDAQAIAAIPLCTRQVDDFWSWIHEKNGVFTVQSAYRMLVSTKARREAWLEGRADSSNSERETKAWTSMWKTNVPSKVKIFLWRLAQQALPTADLLTHSNMATVSSCGLVERTIHGSTLSFTVTWQDAYGRWKTRTLLMFFTT
uniref:Reverse transcriptase zinc-binding domain-containing protein n=1 Tax=Aegilops tauschii subsp. strangulata TaxID=200361 RepID=A0A453F0C4_AEGTS